MILILLSRIYRKFEALIRIFSHDYKLFTQQLMTFWSY